jgi:ribulose 1,5-bisphosphate carboxylase large subunit-like protein
MQKWNLIAPILLLATAHSALAENIPSSVADNNLEIPAVAPEQDHIASMMEDNFSFETEHRKLVNELALEELRNKLSKLKNETFQGDEAESASSSITANPGQPYSVGEPKVLLVSNIAGVLRVAVSVGKQIKMVRLNDVFQANGKAYRLFNGPQHGVVTIKEVTP